MAAIIGFMLLNTVVVSIVRQPHYVRMQELQQQVSEYSSEELYYWDEDGHLVKTLLYEKYGEARDKVNSYNNYIVNAILIMAVVVRFVLCFLSDWFYREYVRANIDNKDKGGTSLKSMIIGFIAIEIAYPAAVYLVSALMAVLLY